LCALSLPLFAQSEFSLDVLPRAGIPLDAPNFSPGFGAVLGLDWISGWDGFGDKLPRPGLGLSGAYTGLGTKDGSAFSLFEGGIGPVLEYQVGDRFVLRGEGNIGLYQSSWNGVTQSKAKFGGGFSAAFKLSPSLSLAAYGSFTHYIFSRPLDVFSIGAGLRLNLSEMLRPRARVQGEKIEQLRIFPVSYAWYQENPLAIVRITNNEPNAITNVGLSFYQEQYMNQPTVFAVLPRLLPGESVEIPVKALFNESMLDLTVNITSNAAVQISYRSLGAAKTAELPVQIPIFHRNAFAWDDDRRAAAFVSARDPAARYFARFTGSVADTAPREGIPRNVRYAAALFEALGLYGINYMIDPASSYIELSENASALDSLNYPYQTLLFRGGDCDDLSILFCSLLEVLDIPTAFITIPGHIYMAFDTGLNAENNDVGNTDAFRASHSSLFIEHGGKLWLPLEITIPHEGFAEAWRVGAREWKDAADKARIYSMKESWTVYPPVSVPGAGDRLPVMPEEADIIQALTQSLDRL
jgi:hypothetical protein